jgi:AraC-like DNA-binding protein
VLDRHARDLLARLPDTSRTTSAVRQAVLDGLRQGDVLIDTIARRLAMSARTLQRRLGDEGTTFDALLDATRKELAFSYLAGDSLASSEVAFALGFSDSTAFHRAFKRWTGTTPGAWRQSRRR